MLFRVFHKKQKILWNPDLCSRFMYVIITDIVMRMTIYPIQPQHICSSVLQGSSTGASLSSMYLIHRSSQTRPAAA